MSAAENMRTMNFYINRQKQKNAIRLRVCIPQDQKIIGVTLIALTINTPTKHFRFKISTIILKELTLLQTQKS